MSAAHTPTPWHLGHGENRDRSYFSIAGKNPDGSWRQIAGCDHPSAQSVQHGANPLREQAEANAAHIVRCVNAHDDLVETLRKLISHRDDLCLADYPAVTRARAVLAKVAA